MLLRETLVNWVGVRYGWQHASDRITDNGLTYLVDTRPDNTGFDVALKSTGEVFRLPANSDPRPVLTARNEKRFYRALRKIEVRGPLARLPFTFEPIVMPRTAPREITRDMVVEWLGGAAERITDRAWGYVIRYPANDYVGAGPFILVKRTGAIWYLPSTPNFWPIYEAANEQQLYVTMQVAFETSRFDPARAHDWFPIPTEVTIAGVIDWIRATYGFSHLEDRVTDIGFAFVVNTQPDAFLDGDKDAMTFGNGPAYVIKGAGAVWQLGSNPLMLPVFDATTEAGFYEALGADPAKPDGWVRT